MDKKAALIEALNDRFIDDAQIWVRVKDAGGMNITVQYDTGGNDGVHDLKVCFNHRDLSIAYAFKYIREQIIIRIMPFTVGV
jgi:hypothetical protein